MTTIWTRMTGTTALTTASLLCATLALPASATAQTLISTADGDVQGQIHDNTREFLGIPYAAPPVGPLRFRPPQASTPWGAPLDATTYPPGCSQLPTLTNGDTRIENEDCLYLNVWTPNPVLSQPLPVLFWIHGGSNTSGSTADFVPFPGFEGQRLYDGHFMSGNRAVVVVTVNYRLNVFGFLGLDELASEDVGHPYAGNQGLLDQRAALQWVQENIAAFGGDPNNVTIYGESAGSFDVCAHVFSPMSAGLFHKAISQSGGCTVGVQTEQESSDAADVIAEAVGCDLAPDRLACMRTASTADLLDAGPLVALVGEGTNLALSVDGGFLTEQPRETLDRPGRLPKIPYILGSNSEEGSLFFIGSPELTEAEYSAELVSRYGTNAPEIEALYPASGFPTPREALIRVFGDSALVCSTYDVAKRYARKHQKTYVYNFSRVPSLGLVDSLDLGAFHGLEIAYVFGSVEGVSSVDRALSDRIQEYWSSFAETGRPRLVDNFRWPRFHPRNYKILRLDAPLSLPTDFRRAQCDFWSTLYDTGDF